MDPTVTDAANAAVSSISASTWKPTGEAANTAFSGSAVLELELTDPKKLVVLKHSTSRGSALPAETDQKSRAVAAKTDRSNHSECAFLQAYPSIPNCRIPETLYASNYDSSDTAGCTLLMESLSHWTQVVEVSPGAPTDAAMKWLANFHAAFLPRAIGGGGLPLQAMAEGGGWEKGMHLELSKRPPGELEQLPAKMAGFASRFSKGGHEYFESKAAMTQGERLAKVAEAAAGRVGGGPHWTMVHGYESADCLLEVMCFVLRDYKQGNMFFGEPSADNQLEIALFDWQWTGPGVGATDLVYVCAMALSDAACENYEEAVLKVYHGHLMEALGPEGVYEYDELLVEFQWAMLDYQRWQGGSRMPSMTPETMTAANENVDYNHGIYRRSMRRMVWMWRLVDQLLDRIDAGELRVEE